MDVIDLLILMYIGAGITCWLYFIFKE